MRRLSEIQELGNRTSSAELNEFLGVDEAIAQWVIAGTSDQVLERLTALVDRVGPFGNLVMVGHDLDPSNIWQLSTERLVADVMPKLAQHAASARAND